LNGGAKLFGAGALGAILGAGIFIFAEGQAKGTLQTEVNTLKGEMAVLQRERKDDHDIILRMDEALNGKGGVRESVDKLVKHMEEQKAAHR
jgi:hypothetical protein